MARLGASRVRGPERPRMLRRSTLAAALAALAVLCAPAGAGAAVRQFWIAATPTTWNVVPNQQDAMMHMRYSRADTVLPTVVYERYDRGWRHVLRDDPRISGDNDRIPGPILHAREGDRLVIHFKNLDTLLRRPHSMHFHGLRYEPSSDGAYLPGFSGRDADVKVGGTWTYRLTAQRGSAGFWPYHDHGPDMTPSIMGGMYGGLSILGPHERAPDRELVVAFSTMKGFMTIDGRAFVGNTPVFHAHVGDLVQWDVMAMGDDFHTFHVHGHRWRQNGITVDTRTVGPAESFRVRWREDAPGTWLYHCHVEGHMEHGMIGLYRVFR